MADKEDPPGQLQLNSQNQELWVKYAMQHKGVALAFAE